MGAAFEIAAVDGLDALTIGRLAVATSMSKAGVFAHYGSKEAIQLAVIDHAVDSFSRRVVSPALEAPPGLVRIRDFLDRYLRDISCSDTPGGCFFTTAQAAYAGRPGPIHDRLAEVLRSLHDLTANELRAAVTAGEMPAQTPVARLAYEIVALAQATSVEYQFFADPTVLEHCSDTLKAQLPPESFTG